MRKAWHQRAFACLLEHAQQQQTPVRGGSTPLYTDLRLGGAFNAVCGAVSAVGLCRRPWLEKDIREWIKHWNEDPRPYVWVKTADQILASLARYCERVSAATGANEA